MKSANLLNVKLNPTAKTEEEFMQQIDAKMKSMGIIEGEPLTFSQATTITSEVFNIPEEAARLMIIVDMAKGVLPFAIQPDTMQSVN